MGQQQRRLARRDLRRRRVTENHVLVEALEQRLMLSIVGAAGGPTPAAPGRPDLAAACDSGLSSSDNVTNVNWSLTFSVGSTTPGATVLLYANGMIIGSAVASGATTEIVTGYGITLSDGEQVITARQSDHGKQSADSPALSVYIDTAAPVGSAPDLAAGSDTGSSSEDNITQGVDPVFAGTASDAGATDSGVAMVELHSADGKTASALVTGDYSLAMPTIDEGTWDVFAYVYDLAGNSCRTQSVAISVDRTAPTASIPDLDVFSDSGISSTDNITNVSSPTFYGTASDGGTFASGIWKINLRSDDGPEETAYAGDYSLVLLNLAEGSRQVTADAYDLAGNVGTSPILYVDTDYTDPLPGSIALSAGSDTGMSNSDHITSDETPTFDVSAEQYFRFYRSTVQISGDYETGSTFTAGVQAPGSYAYSMCAVDAAGNVSGITQTPVTIDISPPTCTVPDLSTDTGVSSTDNITNTTAPLFTGSASDPSSGIWKVELFTDEGASWCGGWAGGGLYPYSATMPTPTEGSRTVWAKAYDLAGNTYTTPVLSYTVDRTAPPVGTISLTAGSDTGESSGDGITNDNTPTFTIGGAGPYFRVYLGGTLFSSSYLIGSSYTSSSMPDGIKTYTMKAVDAAGNESASSGPAVVRIDRVAPSGTIPDLNAASDTGTSSTDNITQAISPQFDGTANDVVGVYTSGIWKVVVSSNDGKSAIDIYPTSYSVVLPTLSEGTRIVSAKIYDVAGNIFTTSGLVVYVDRTPPTASAPDLADGSDTGDSFSDDITRAANMTFTGTVADGGAYVSGATSVQVNVDGVATGTGTVSAGAYTATVIGISEGTHAITVQATDKAGNVGTAGSSLTIYVDRTAPTVGVPDLAADDDTGVSNTDNITASMSPLFTGTAFETPSVYASGFSKNRISSDVGWYYTPPNVGGSYSQEFPSLPEGIRTITVTGYDIAGNFASSTLNITVDISGAVSGTLDSHFGTAGKATAAFAGASTAYSILLQPDGKSVLVGLLSGMGATAPVALARFNADGSLDGAFGTSGTVLTTFFVSVGQGYNYVNKVYAALQSDGKIVVAGSAPGTGVIDFGVARFNPDGSLDTSFGTGGIVTTPLAAGTGPDFVRAVAVQADGKIVVAGSGSDYAFGLVRYNPDGTLDNTFGTGGIVKGPGGQVQSMVIQPDGKIIVGGNVYIGGAQPFVLTRYNTDGTPDATFGAGGTVQTSFGATYAYYGAYLALQPNGKIIAAGTGYSNVLMARYNSDGTLDTTFGDLGTVNTSIGTGSIYIYSAAVQDDGKILLCGYGYGMFLKGVQILLLRFDASGNRDSTFGENGIAFSHTDGRPEYGFAMALAPGGRVLVAGSGMYSPNQRSDFLVARFYGAQPAIDLQASSDTGISDSDNITRDTTPVFDIDTPEYYRVYRNDVLISGLYETAGSFVSAPQSDTMGAFFSVCGVDAAGNESSSSSILVKIDTAAPTLVGAQVNGGMANRSVILYLSENFSEGVTGPTAGDLVLRDASGTPVDLSAATFTLDARGTASWDLSSVVLPDGGYTAEFASSGVADIAGNALAGSSTCGASFFRLAGDGDGSGIVDMSDYADYFNNYGRTVPKLSPGDLDGNGLVDMGDYAMYFNNYGNVAGSAGTIEPVVSAVPSAGGAELPLTSREAQAVPTAQRSEAGSGAVQGRIDLFVKSGLARMPAGHSLMITRGPLKHLVFDDAESVDLLSDLSPELLA